MAIDLKGKVIVITGASSGIGAATAVECARAGMNVVLNARRADRIEAVAEAVRRFDAKALSVAGDVTDPGMSERMLDAATEGFGRFDVVFANAGYGFERPMAAVELDDLRRIFDVNFFAAMDLLKVAANRLLAEQRPGHLLMCSSCVAKFSLPGYGAYSATKAAQSQVCRSMRTELEPHSIEVSSVHPITTTTEFFEVAQRLSGREPTAKVAAHAPKWMVQTPEHVARAVVKSLRRPRPEVWTSWLVRAVAAAMTLSPRFTDVLMRRVR